MNTSSRHVVFAILTWSGATATWAAPSLEVEHEAIGCVPADRHARLSVRGVPADQVARAELQFRVGATTGWYSIAMAAEEGSGSWWALLPRPTPSLDTFRYRVVLHDRQATETSTPEREVRVATADEMCPATTEAALDAPIVVRVPPGAPPTPPVPAGFSPVGAAGLPAAPSRIRRSVAVLGALAVAAGGATALTAGGSDAFVPEVPLRFTFGHTVPPEGGTLSLGRGRLVVTMLLDETYAGRLFLSFQVDLMAGEGRPVCATMSGSGEWGSGAAGASFTGPVTLTGSCGDRFDVTALRVFIRAGTLVAHDAVHPVSLHVEP